jgi:hypothetical protein
MAIALSILNVFLCCYFLYYYKKIDKFDFNDNDVIDSDERE